jgi:hypothetical protein
LDRDFSFRAEQDLSRMGHTRSDAERVLYFCLPSVFRMPLLFYFDANGALAFKFTRIKNVLVSKPEIVLAILFI